MADAEVNGAGSVAHDDMISGMGVNLLGLFGGFDAILATLLVAIYNSNRDRIGEAADRAFTVSDRTFNQLCRSLAIPDNRRSDIRKALDAFADHAGDVLVAIADAKADGQLHVPP